MLSFTTRSVRRSTRFSRATRRTWSGISASTQPRCCTWPALSRRVWSGAIGVTGNTAAFRGIPNYALFSPTKAAQRNLAQALARDLGPRGVHIAYFNIDAVIDVPWTRDRFHPDKPEEFFAKPADIADEVFHVVQQPRSAWSFDVEIRPFGEKW